MNLVGYSYPEYSTLEVSLILSVTHCKPVNINICAFDYRHRTYFGKILAAELTEDMQGVYRESSAGGKERVFGHADYLRFSVNIGKCFILEMNHAEKPVSTRKGLRRCHLEELKHVGIADPGKLINYNVKGFLDGRLIFFINESELSFSQIHFMHL